MAIGDLYNSRDDFKTALDITDDSEDDWIDKCLKGAQTALHRRSGWPTFWNTDTPVTRTVEAAGKVVPVRQAGYSYTKLLLRDGIASTVGFVVKGYSAASLIQPDLIDEGKPVDSIKLPAFATYGTLGTLDITAVWGWPEVPDDIIWAHHLQSQRLYKRKGSPEGIAGSAEWGLSRVPRLDPDVLAILKDGNYMRAGIG